MRFLDSLSFLLPDFVEIGVSLESSSVFGRMFRRIRSVSLLLVSIHGLTRV